MAGEFDYRFQVDASVEAVRAFHGSTSVLRKLTPPPTWMQVHRFGELEENMIAEFTMWLGPIPLRWKALHRDVGPGGFTDVQLEGPMQRWEHHHRFNPLASDRCEVHEHIDFEHSPGVRGVFTRMLFNPLSLRFLFAYRAWVTRRLAPEARPG